MKVLITESDAHQLSRIERLCQGLDCQITKASSVESAVEQCKAQAFELIYSGHYLSDATGFELCRKLRRDLGVTAPIVLVTKDSHQAFLEKAFSEGISETFTYDEFDELSAYIARRCELFKPFPGYVLLVEDSPAQQQLLSETLKNSGLRVDVCSSAEDAWRMFQERDYELVVTDIVLEGPDSGLRLVNRIRRSNDASGDTPIIVITAYDDPQRQVELIHQGADDYISKPVVVEVLVARCRRLIKSSRLAREVTASHTAMSQFLGRMSHECRNSINVISGICKRMLRSDGLQPRQHQSLSMIENAAAHQLELVNDILDYSKLQSSELKLTAASYPIRALLVETLEMFRYKAEERGLEFQVRVNPELPKSLILDARKVKQVLMNLLGNAVKFADSGIVTVSAMAEGQSLLLSVADEGPGIEEKGLKLLFKAFGQTQLGKQEKGTGLGLAICAELAELMGGGMSVTSQPGQGSTFTLKLPLNPAL